MSMGIALVRFSVEFASRCDHFFGYIHSIGVDACFSRKHAKQAAVAHYRPLLHVVKIGRRDLVPNVVIEFFITLKEAGSCGSRFFIKCDH